MGKCETTLTIKSDSEILEATIIREIRFNWSLSFSDGFTYAIKDDLTTARAHSMNVEAEK